jgi:hypothetical protein
MTINNPISNLSVIADAFPSPDGQGVRAAKKIVTAGTVEMGGNEFYIQEPGGVSAIRVISTTVVQEGNTVTVVGDLVTDCGERSINATSADMIDSQPSEVKPFGMPNRSVGGSDVNEYTKGVTGGIGLRNVGVLIKSWGVVTYVGNEAECFFYIDDGSGLCDGSGHDGLRVECRGLSKPAMGSTICVTGLSSCKVADTIIIPIIKLRKQSDINLISL